MAQYEGNVHIEPKSRTIVASWTIKFVPTPQQYDSVTLLLSPDLRVNRVDGPEGSSVKQVLADGLNRIVVTFKSPLASSDTGRIEMSYVGQPTFGADSINGIGERWIELGLDSFWHPVFAGYDERLSAVISLQIAGNWDVAASGLVAQRQEGAMTLYNQIPQSDIAFAAAPRLNRSANAAGTVYSVSAGDTTVARVAHSMDVCATSLNALYATEGRRLPDTRVVIAPRGGPGYARQNYIIITDPNRFSEPDLLKFVCHEFAHYWSSAAPASGSENWLNEGLAEFVAARVVGKSLGRATYDSMVVNWGNNSRGLPPVWTRKATRRPFAGVAYRKAPFLLSQLEVRIGSAKMQRVLERYMREHVTTTVQLLAIVGEIAGTVDALWFEEQLAL